MYKKLTNEEKKAKIEQRKQDEIKAKELTRIEQEKNQPKVKELTITIEWKKSRTWGNNPHAEAKAIFHDPNAGNYGFKCVGNYTCSGCGYDKESTVIADIFNDFLKYKLWELNISLTKKNNGGEVFDIHKNNIPYGIVCYSIDEPHYSGGIGTSCYYKISEFIGGKFERIAGGSTFDVYRYTDGI